MDSLSSKMDESVELSWAINYVSFFAYIYIYLK